MSAHIFIITGPAGVGKTTVAHALMRRFRRLKKIVTYTTRLPRPGEVQHRDYHFVSRAAFEKKLAARDFFEHAVVHGDLYGNAWADLKRVQAEGHAVLFVVDPHGARTLKKKLRGSVVIFLVPENFEVLRRRLARRRTTESPEHIVERLKTAHRELRQQHIAHYIIVNRQGDRHATENAVARIVRREMGI